MSGPIRLKLPARDVVVYTGPSDPLPFYYKPLIGGLYRGRIDAGLRYLPDYSDVILEVGYGGGLLLPTLARHCRHVIGVDRHALNDQVQASLTKQGVSATLLSGDARRLPFPERYVDVVLAFSFLEHVQPVDVFIAEMLRVLRPGGKIILGMPMVNKAFSLLFPIFCQFNVEDHHISSPADVRRFLKRTPYLSFRESGIPRYFPAGGRIYTIFEISLKS